jgi:hypothetical protein
LTPLVCQHVEEQIGGWQEEIGGSGNKELPLCGSM